MLRKVFIPLACIIVPCAFWYMLQFAKVEEVPFSKAIAKADAQSESDQNKKFSIPSTIVHNSMSPLSITESGAEFYVRDSEGTLFRVQYDGKEPANWLKDGLPVKVYGHVHIGSKPYFHSSQIVQ